MFNIFINSKPKKSNKNKFNNLKKLQDLKNKIEEEQAKQKQSKLTKSENHKPVPSNDSKLHDFSKSYMLDFSLKSQQKARPNSTKSFNDFYQKNKRWKQNLQAQIMKRKQEKIEQEEKQLSQCRKPLSEKEVIQNNTSKPNQSLTHAFDSKGPISGWTQRFHSYIKKRLPQELQQDFKPKINKKSQIIASRMVGKVQDRLIKFGEIMKMRKHQMLIQEIEKIGKFPSSDTHFSSTNSNKSQFFYRLYKEGEKTNRKTKEKFQQAMRNEFSYKPKITQLDESMERKVKQKREKNPLYRNKKMSKQETERLMEMFQKETGRVMKESDFQNFMRRNEILLEKKERNLQKKLKEEVIKAENQLKQCTFIPILNKKSMRMLGNMQNGKIIETQEENEDFGYELEDGNQSDLLWNKERQNRNQKSGGKYSYEHSYRGAQQFEYSFNTPSTQKREVENQFQLKTQNKQRLNQVSQIDSLEFSGQKQQQNTLFNRHNFSMVNLSSQKKDEIINYELTFSNKKLTKQLSSLNQGIQLSQNQQIKEQRDNKIQFNHLNGLTDHPDIQCYNIDKQLNSINDKCDLTDRQAQKGTINDWQNELQKVKSRLQKLMKNNKKSK